MDEEKQIENAIRSALIDTYPEVEMVGDFALIAVCYDRQGHPYRNIAVSSETPIHAIEGLTQGLNRWATTEADKGGWEPN